MKSASLSSVAPRPSRLVHFTPLRYPGGKAKLAAYVKTIIESNNLIDGEYVEPYAGGAGIALELLFHEYVSKIYINDISRPIYSFWKSVLDHTDELVRLVRTVKPSVHAWDRQKRILSHPKDHDDVQLGFATFFLNRTNRSGILNGGIVGGRDQSGPWKIDARYNAEELAYRIAEIAKLRDRIELTRRDALIFLKSGINIWSTNTLIYLDPPYYVKGRDLYLDSYTHDDHEAVATFVRTSIAKQKWLVSYDNAREIRKLYSGCQNVIYSLQYSARDAHKGSEVMFFGNELNTPEGVRPVLASPGR